MERWSVSHQPLAPDGITPGLSSDAVAGIANQARNALNRTSILRWATAAGVVAALGLLFQVGHFAEHAAQFVIWVLGDLSNICGRDTPWMSPWVTDVVGQIASIVFSAGDTPRGMMLGMEILHLVGNSIFLISLVCLYYCIGSKWVRWACYIEAFHLVEHISLTTTAYFVGKPIGLSTLLGTANIIGGREFAVGFRVSWHFVMNLLPIPFAMVGLMEYFAPKCASAAA